MVYIEILLTFIVIIDFFRLAISIMKIMPEREPPMTDEIKHLYS